MVLMAPKAIRVQLEPLETQVHLGFKVCQEKEGWQELLVPRVTVAA